MSFMLYSVFHLLFNVNPTPKIAMNNKIAMNVEMSQPSTTAIHINNKIKMAVSAKQNIRNFWARVI